MSTPVTAAPSEARLRESPPELHCRWRSVLPSRSPSNARSSGKRVLPPSRRYPARSPRWLSCTPATAFQESRFCSRCFLRSTGGFYLLTLALSVSAPPRLPRGRARSSWPCPPSGGDLGHDG